ncbi:bifunctional sugar phosphate isomerase/epimerase/4-hydroxyphenylpyruvate dioxygenase family protein [Demequina zhanjiangensis]|uniref:3-dehydroshikimate dehydratase n=1 Tax=Demequina zhanjiangensis TaxID=3051659 RepID=A0ABT8G3X2_9MICO|nr:sugar phosphate isomerase/epimerase and 4-hydroxyphenylpyruvate domain-containing protein [Demequina sp. SYSU T00b26]MDN4473634.1 TIM barrel protein [Demequina sp. SYSU T00b26]
MRTSIATVCLSGGLVEKLESCAAAGFDGVEIMDADLVAAVESPEEIRALCARLGLTIDMYQPFRDVEGVTDDEFQDTLRRAEAKFTVMDRLGTDLMLVCSNVGTASIDDDALAAEQLGALADLAATHGIRLAYEALAWGRYVNDYRHAWDIVRRADRPNLGTCLDSFHILSRGDDPSGIEQIDGERIYFVQLADAPVLDMDLLSWSRHHRLFPGEGGFDLIGLLGHIDRAGYRGPISLEVFNDTFRQTDVSRTAAHARRSLTWLADRTSEAEHRAQDRLPAAQQARGIDFVEIAGQDLAPVDELLSQLGFSFGGRHRSKDVRLWEAGDARLILNEQRRSESCVLSAIGLSVDDAATASARGELLGAPPVFRRTYAGEHELRAVAAPDGTEVYWSDAGAEPAWLPEFVGGSLAATPLRAVVDHINIGHPWQEFDEAVLFAGAVLGLTPEPVEEVPGPVGLVRSQVMRSADDVVRLAINVAPPTSPEPPRHVALACDDVLAATRHAKAAGAALLPVPANYYDDLEARFGGTMDRALLDELRALGVFYDRQGAGEFLHVYTQAVGGVFFELVERRGGYDGYGAPNAPVRLGAQRRVAAHR